MTLLLVMVGGAVGALSRWAVDLFCRRRFGPELPWGTFAVNVTGSFVLGALAGAGAAAGGWGALLGTGFCGALTTYSTFAYQTVRLADEPGRWYAALNVLATLVVGGAAAALGQVSG